MKFFALVSAALPAAWAFAPLHSLVGGASQHAPSPASLSYRPRAALLRPGRRGATGAVARPAAKKGFGKEPPPPRPTPEPAAAAANGKFDTQPTVSFVPPSAAGDFPEPSPAAREAIEAMRLRKTATAQTSTLKVGEFDEVQAELKVNPTAGVIPDKVAKRMLFRMLPLAAVPIFGGIGLFLYFYWSATQGGAEFQPTVVAYMTTVPWLLGLFGLTYGLLSTSWDEDVEGSFLGTTELKLNLGRLSEGLTRGQDNMAIREMQDKQRD